MSETEKILEMISEGKISANDGERLLNAIHGNTREEKPVLLNENQSLPDKKNKENKDGNVIIEISSKESEIVKLKLPINFTGFMLNMIPAEKLSGIEVDGLNISEVLNNISNLDDGVDRDIVNITTEDGDSIRIHVKYNNVL